ncbi:MAG: polysaccharide export protein [Bacteroidetes bacterium]|nr:polysaccharide export protein [Bacteroidota bacterium]
MYTKKQNKNIRIISPELLGISIIPIRMLKWFVNITVLFILFSACTSNKKLFYLQNKSHRIKPGELIAHKKYLYKIQPNDILSVKILGLDLNTTSFFNIESNTAFNQYNPAALYLNGYSVNDSGYIYLPIIGPLKVKDLNIEEAASLVQSKIDEHLSKATVIVKLVSFKLTVLGEVKKPGMYNIYNDRVTILEALGLAGDITDFGNRTNVMLIRQTARGTMLFNIDLTDSELIGSELYFLNPGDVIYVEPLRTKQARLSVPTASLILSGITTLVLILNLFRPF